MPQKTKPFGTKKDAYGVRKTNEFVNPIDAIKPTKNDLPLSAKRMLVYQIEKALTKQGMPRTRLAELLGTSRAAVNRLLDPENRSVTLQTIERVSEILGKRLHIFFYDREGVL